MLMLLKQHLYDNAVQTGNRNNELNINTPFEKAFRSNNIVLRNYVINIHGIKQQSMFPLLSLFVFCFTLTYVST